MECVPRLDERRPEPVAEDGLDLLVDPVADRRVVQRVLDHVLPDDADAHAGQGLLSPVAGNIADDEAGVGLVGDQRTGHRRVDVPRIEVAQRGVDEGVEHEGGVADGAAVDARAVHQRVRPDGAAVGDQPLGRQQADGGVARRRPLARPSRLLAEGAGDEVRGHRDARPRARAPRRALGVVGVAGLAAPRAPLGVAQVTGGRGGGPAGVADAAVELGRVGLGVDDGALRAQPLDDGRVGRRRVHREVDVRRRRRPHVPGVVDVLEPQGDAVHGHRRQIRLRAVARIELRRPLEGVGLPPEGVAGGGAVGRNLPRLGVRVARARAAHRSLAAQVQRAQRVDLTRVGDTRDHAVLRLHGGVRQGGLHPPQVERHAAIPVEVGKDARDRHGGRGEAHRRPGANRAARRRHRRPVEGDEPGAGAVVGPGPVDVGLHHALTARPAVPDGPVNVLDGRFLDLEAVRLTRLRLRGRDRRHQQQPGPNGHRSRRRTRRDGFRVVVDAFMPTSRRAGARVRALTGPWVSMVSSDYTGRRRLRRPAATTGRGDREAGPAGGCPRPCRPRWCRKRRSDLPAGLYCLGRIRVCARPLPSGASSPSPAGIRLIESM